MYFSPFFLMDRGMKVDLCILVPNFTRFHFFEECLSISEAPTQTPENKRSEASPKEFPKLPHTPPTHTHTHTATCDHTCACNFHRSKLFEESDVDVGGRVKHGTQRCHGRKPDLPPGHRCEEKNLMRYAVCGRRYRCEATSKHF